VDSIANKLTFDAANGKIRPTKFNPFSSRDGYSQCRVGLLYNGRIIAADETVRRRFDGFCQSSNERYKSLSCRRLSQ
jgi:hypothetical protein